MNVRNPFSHSPLKAAIFASASFILVAALMLLAYQMWGQSIIAEAYHGRSWFFLHRLMEGKAGYSVEHYYEKAEEHLYQVVVALVVMSLVFYAVHFWRLLDRHRVAILFILGAAILVIPGWISLVRPFWYDELFTYYASNGDTAGAVLRSLINGADNHPPLDYILRHYSMAFFRDSAFAFRLPSVISALLASICLYLFARRRTSFFPAAVAFAFPVCTLAVRHFHEGRAYMPMLALACLALLAWQRAAEKPASVGRQALLVASLTLGPFFHFYGVFSMVPIMLGEAVRTIESRRVCWPVITSFGISLASLVLLYPFLANSVGFAGTFWTRVTPAELLFAYGALLKFAGLAFFGFLVVFLMRESIMPGRRSPDTVATTFPGYEIAAAITYCLVPVMVYLAADLVTGAFLARYAIIAIIGFALLASLAVSRIAASNQGYAAAFMAYFWLAGMANLGGAAAPFLASAQDHLRMVAIIEEDLREESLPIVIPHAHRFLETFHYLPAQSKDRVFYIADPALAVAYQGYDTEERAAINLKKVLSVNALSLCELLEQSPDFIALGEGRWLMSKLEDDQADITTSKLRGVSVHRVKAGALSKSACPWSKKKRESRSSPFPFRP